MPPEVPGCGLRVFCRAGARFLAETAELEGAMLSGHVTFANVPRAVNVVTLAGFVRVGLKRVTLASSAAHLVTARRTYRFDKLTLELEPDPRLALARAGSVFVTAEELECGMRSFVVKAGGAWGPRAAGSWGVGLVRYAAAPGVGEIFLPGAFALQRCDAGVWWGALHVLCAPEAPLATGGSFVLQAEEEAVAFGTLESEIPAPRPVRRPPAPAPAAPEAGPDGKDASSAPPA